ncbi:GAF domain-containing protein [Asaia sp. As-1742]|uniref:GAF domain-containing protein n=1 Tax=Asaia sp. As-1742 TaxID=2608325 RepID=UPI0014223A4B|nr:GAF domain-containing protein [Asaia sp. As-1742]NIE78674.1 GAF domain-containing protein [Asaia sp. As-1742]
MSAPDTRLTQDDILSAVEGLVSAESDMIANMANIAAVLFEALPRINWAGFYLLREGELVLGPFQGRVACTRIALGRGVCGKAASERSIQRIDNVHSFPGHIACDAASASEIVLPLVRNGELLGVLDIDSPEQARFGDAEQAVLERVVTLLLDA